MGVFELSPEPGRLEPRDLQVRDLAAAHGALFAATDQGLVQYKPAQGVWESLVLPAELYTPDDDLRALALSPDEDLLYVASAQGLSRVPLPIQGVQEIPPQLTPGLTGLPSGDLTSVAVGEARVLIGHSIGASALSPDRLSPGEGPLFVEHYHSLRWMPDSGGHRRRRSAPADDALFCNGAGRLQGALRADLAR